MTVLSSQKAFLTLHPSGCRRKPRAVPNYDESLKTRDSPNQDKGSPFIRLCIQCIPWP